MYCPFVNSRKLIAPLCLLIILLAVPTFAGQEITEDGVLHIVNTDQPTNGVKDLELEELWTVGGEDDEDILLGIVSGVLIDDDNNIYLLDAQLSQVQVISAEGEMINTLGRAGSGPGEITNPGDFVFMPDGTLGLVQIFPGKIVKLNMDGTAAGELNPGDTAAGGFLALVNCRAAGGNLVLSGIKISPTADNTGQLRHHFVRSYDLEGNQLCEYLTKDVEWDFRNLTYSEIDSDFIWWRMDVGGDGRVIACENRYDYALSVYSPDGTLERVIDRPYESWQRTPKMKQRYRTLMEAQAAGQFPPGTPIEVEDKEQDVMDLRIARDGRIWVLPSRQMYDPDPGFFATYDVFSPEGHFEMQARVACEGKSTNDRLIFAGDDRVFKITGFWDTVLAANSAGDDEDSDEEPQPMAVTCYRIK